MADVALAQAEACRGMPPIVHVAGTRATAVPVLDRFPEYLISRFMEKSNALEVFAALAHETRIDVFRLLVGAGKDGLAAGEVAVRLGVRQNTMSTNLAILARAGLLRRAREGRSIRYRADLGTMRALLAYLMRDCCGGRPEICASIIEHSEPVP